MADKNNKMSNNIAGSFYVDGDACIGCGLCCDCAPDNFRLDDVEGKAYVYFQPINDGQKEQCKEALGSCPVEAIGNDG